MSHLKLTKTLSHLKMSKIKMPQLSKYSNFLRFRVLNRPLELAKTHDFCKTKTPVLTVILLHGIASSSSTFRNTLKYLEGTTALKNVRFITFDWLGSGKSYASDRLDYDYDDQLIALHHSIQKLKLQTPLVLIGHSMGTLLATRYAAIHKKSVKKLILISPPVYTKENLKNPAFKKALDVFRESVSRRDRNLAKTKSFTSSMENIVKDPHNYKTLATLTTNSTLIYSRLDPIIAPFNIPKIAKLNPKHLTLIKTNSNHHVTNDKYSKIPEILIELMQ